MFAPTYCRKGDRFGSLCPTVSLSQKLNDGLIKISNYKYIAFDNTDMMMPDSLVKGHICRSFSRFNIIFLLF